MRTRNDFKRGVWLFVAVLALVFGQTVNGASNCGDADYICRNRYRDCSSCVECCNARYSCAVSNCNKLQEPYRYTCLMVAEREKETCLVGCDDRWAGCGGE